MVSKTIRGFSPNPYSDKLLPLCEISYQYPAHWKMIGQEKDQSVDFLLSVS